MDRTPVIHVYGISDSGKTQLVERLLNTLIQKGHRVGTVKLSRAGSLDLDHEGKDTDRHIKAGSMVTGATSHTNSAVIVPEHLPKEKLIGMMEVTGRLDLVIVEGLGDDTPDTVPKVAVGETKGIAPGTVVELSGPEGDIGDLLHVIDRMMAKRHEDARGEQVELRVNGIDVPIKAFVRDYLEGTVRGAVGALKEAGGPGDAIDLHIPKREDDEPSDRVSKL